MNTRRFAFASILLAASLAWTQQYQYPFQNPNLPVEARINNILSLMTLDEKISALSTNPDVPRLGIHGSGHIEGLHGVAYGGPGGWQGRGLKPLPTTQFPQSVGLGETWDPDLLQKAAAIEGYEARYIFQSEENFTEGRRGKHRREGIVVRAPNADLARDPRWGRGEESYGEDPFLTGTMAVAFVHGLQGENPRYWLTASLMKHFLANSNEDGRGGSSSNFDERLLREYYSVPFRMGAMEGGSRAYMTAYNAYNGIPMAAQPILRDMTMHEWGFDGIICTDSGALTNMVTQHKYFPDIDQATAGAVHAGINQFLDNYRDGATGAIEKKLVNLSEIDENLRGVYRVMIRLGLLDPPELVPYSSIKGSTPVWDNEEHKALARKITQESIVLLKNEALKNAGKLLPLDRSKLRRVSVIGPYADQVALDWYSGTPAYAVSPLDGIRNKLGSGVNVDFARDNKDDAALKIARRADVAIMIVGNHPTCNAGWNVCPLPSDGKEAIDRKSITLEQEELVKQVLAVNPRTVVVLISSFPFAIQWTQEHAPAILHMAHNSQEEGNALADALFGDYDPAGRLVVTWPMSLDQLPPMMDYDLRHGRTYMYFRGKPLYPFGYGLSYTTFAYSNLRISSGQLKRNGEITVSFDVQNTGSRAGDEVVQMYVSHVNSKVDRPIEELKGFKRVALGAGERKTVSLPLKASALSYWNTARGTFEVEPDQVNVKVGSSSADIKLQQVLSVSPE
ncbi:MAG TPA: glycoside hydrolase family 3 C-terminal domain-containing protein [Terriglobales bacterium]|nr:glycoside hydrolase family 3 C-terminal domain-containing protein [Terriglobales bacterium]